MLLSWKWVCEIAGFEPQAAAMAERLTFSGLEIEGMRRVGAGLEKVVVGMVTTRERHPTRQGLSIVRVDSGSGMVQVACGAPNCPGPGGRVALALPGASVAGVVVEPRSFGDVRSEGMLCSEDELSIGPDRDGLLILGDDTPAVAGTPIAAALGLDDVILAVNVTPNRPDALSHRGIAREIALLFGRVFDPVRVPAARESGPSVAELASVEVLAPGACPRYAAAVVTGVEVRRSPFGLRYRLHNLGIRPISNLVDITNAMLLEFGQPLHAFDLDRLAGHRIVVRKAVDGERMTTLDGIERVFCSDDLLICDGQQPVAVAGVMGGLTTGIGESTTRLFIECAYFRPKGIRRTSKRLKLASESSFRFERGIDPSLAPEVLGVATAMTQRLAGGVKAPRFIDVYPRPIERKVIVLRPSRYAAIMGGEVKAGEMRRILTGLGAEVREIGSDLEVAAPTARPDLEREIDLVEEVARIRGFEEIPAALPRVECAVPDRPEHEAARRAKEVLASLGLVETIGYSFVPQQSLEALGAAKGVVRIANPLSSERASLRTTLLVGLLENLKRAYTRFVPGLRQFEVGRTFHDEGDELPCEVLRAAAILSGPRDAWMGSECVPLDLFDAKGIVAAFVTAMSGAEPVFEPIEDVTHLHPRRAWRIMLHGEEIGSAGEIHPLVLAAEKLPRGVCGFEVVVRPLWDKRTRSAVKPLPEYPPMARDVALLVDEMQDAGPIAESLAAACAPLGQDVVLFDVYRGDRVSSGKKSLAFSVVYRAPDRTLTDQEVDEVHKRAVEAVTVAFGAHVR
ncbi:MAG: phenylalanine--tRNA ligase subunit beta [Deltaproteobacteria bacterium]|nr:phenylalanine--tRNA ligase subunit beta [Deltaproteobacteria bacterium]